MKFERITYKEWSEIMHDPETPELDLIGDFCWFMLFCVFWFPLLPFFYLLSLTAHLLGYNKS